MVLAFDFDQFADELASFPVAAFLLARFDAFLAVIRAEAYVCIFFALVAVTMALTVKRLHGNDDEY